jgi:guanosine-3',5'-bis(diphosphate) 3'-pyrophosphohydrolase
MRLATLMEIAYEAHAGQLDKADKPYILHPWRVSVNVFSKVSRLRIFQGLSDEILNYAVKACVGHDLVEDTKVTLAFLRERGLEEPVVVAIGYLSKEDGEDYFDFCRRCMLNTISHIAKICDIVDNIDLERIPAEERTEKDYTRNMKYGDALRLLGVKEDEFEMLLTYN